MADNQIPEPADAVAVIGLTCRFPGAGNAEEYWRNLCAGTETIHRLRPGELAASGVPESVYTGADYVPARGVLGGVDLFDAGYFGLTPREAAVTDPQHRLLLECAEEALQDAGYDSERLRHRVGVFAGCGAPSYLQAIGRRPDIDPYDMEIALGNGVDFLATRVGYKLNLTGPCVTVQTACSTGLVAIHLACQSLLDDECTMAIAGAASIVYPEQTGYTYRPGSIMSPDGHCRAFDAAAQGTVGGNGCGAVVLKRLDRAVRDRDHIRCVVLGSAINNDGSAKVGFTAPSVRGQRNAIRRAHAAAGVTAASVSYVEAHGTGTPLGDPIELAALGEVFDAEPGAGPCLLGSVKTNIGHLDTAAGLAGFIKAALAVEHGQIPATLHYTRPNPQARPAGGRFQVVTELTRWPERATPRRAGVSSFGIGGTNAHAVLQEGPAPADTAAPAADSWQLVPLSARDEGTLDRFGAEAARHLAAHPELPFADMAFTMQTGRRELDHRLAVVARTAAEAATALSAGDPAAVVRGTRQRATEPRIAFAFPGQGTEFAGMARDLVATEPAFAAELRDCLTVLRRHTDADLEGFLTAEPRSGDPGTPVDTALAQPALFAVGYALARWWMSRGVRPACLLGHSLGELTAATVAGVFALDDAAGAVVRRGELMGAAPGGTMRVVFAPAAALAGLLPPTVSLAAVNTPNATVVSGPTADVAALTATLTGRGIRTRRLPTGRAFHSALMADAADAFGTTLDRYPLGKPAIPLVSTVTGDWLSDVEATDPRYWATQLRQPVRFADGCRRVLDAEVDVVLEVGAGRSLTTLVRDNGTADRPAPLLVASLPTAAPDRGILLRAAGRLWTAGARLDWAAISAEPAPRRVRMPTYPFDRARHTLLDTAGPATSGAGTGRPAATRPGDGTRPAPARPRLDTPHRAPEPGLQQSLAGIFEEVIGVGGLGADDNFFDLGGDSLSGLRLLSRVRELYRVDLPPERFFETPTVAGLAAILDRALEEMVSRLDAAEVSTMLRELNGGTAHD